MSKEFILITPVWGKTHIQLFLNIGLPSLLAANNIPKLSQLSKVKYFIYTKASDADFLKQSVELKVLQELVDLSVIVFEDSFPNHHSAMSWCHKQGFADAQKHASYAVFIPPDCIWSNQAMYAMYQIVERGYKIIHMSGLRLIDELMTKTIKKKDGIISLSSRDLVQCALKFLHPITESHFFDEKEGGLMPANLFWTVDETGILARCFHLHPLVVYGIDKQCDFQSTIDDDLALVFDSVDHEEYVVTDSDELVAFEMSSLSHKVLAAYRKGNITDIANWAQVGTNKKHHSLIQHSIKIHSGDATHPGWLRAQQMTDAIVEDIFKEMNVIPKFSLQKALLVIRNNPLIKKMFSFYAGKVESLINFFYRLMRSSRKVYPWHWSYPFQVEVCIPFINEIKNSSGKILYFDDRYHPLIHALRNSTSSLDLMIDLRDAKVVSNKVEQFSQIYRHFYDVVAIRDFDLSLISHELLTVINAVLKPKGKLFYYFTEDVDVDELQNRMPKELQLISEKNYGGRGTKFFMNQYHKYYQTKLSRSAIMQHRTIINSVKLLLSPLLFMLYPLISITTLGCNFLLKKNNSWAVKKLEFISLKKEREEMLSKDKIKESFPVN